jgi:Na+-transporting NADH:ubiquinone oxidoreductase subunit E
MFIATIASIVQLVEMIVEKLHQFYLGYLPLIAVNCSILGGALFMQEREYASLGEATVFAWFWCGMVSGHSCFICYTRKLRYSNVPGL